MMPFDDFTGTVLVPGGSVEYEDGYLVKDGAMENKLLKNQLESFESYVNDIPLVIDPCKMCKNHDDNKGFDEICSECCWFYDSKFEVKE